MHFLICAATPFEIEPLQQFVQQQQWAHKVQFIITGIGAMAATYSITKAVAHQKPDFILQAGVAGCFDADIALGTTVAVESECVGDLGVVEKETFLSLFHIGLADRDAAPWKNGFLPNPHAHLFTNAALPQVKSVTVNEITTGLDRIRYYKNSLGACIESMEGAALHFVALKEAVPFLQIRAISNYIGERDKSKWLLKNAIANLNETAQTLLKKFM